VHLRCYRTGLLKNHRAGERFTLGKRLPRLQQHDVISVRFEYDGGMAAIGMAETARMAGAPSPRSTMCFSAKFATGHLTRIRVSAASDSFFMVISNGRSPPACAAGGTHACDILTASVAPKSRSVCIPSAAATKPAPASAAVFP